MKTLRDLARKTVGADPLGLTPARVHEAEGRGRRAFALFQAARHPGPVLWVLPAHQAQQPMLEGLPQGLGARLLVLTPSTEVDLLWCVEEGLRALPVGLVIAEPQKPLSLNVGRRLQLAAEAGRTTGLMLIHEDQGSNAAESRWSCAAVPAAETDSTLLQWSTKKNKSGTIGSWTVHWNGTTAAFHLVSPAGERLQSESPPC